MTQAETQSVDVERTRADYLKLARLLYSGQNIQTYRLTSYAIAVIAVGTLHEWLSDLPWVQKNIFYDYGAFYWAGLLVLLGLSVNLVYRVIGRNIEYVKPGQGFLRPRKYEISPQGFVEKTDLTIALVTWKAIVNILRTRDYFLFYVDSMSAYIVPVRSFASKEAADAFYKHARALWTASTGQTGTAS